MSPNWPEANQLAFPNVALRCLYTVLAVSEYMSSPNHGKRKVAAHRLKLASEKYTDERF